MRASLGNGSKSRSAICVDSMILLSGSWTLIGSFVGELLMLGVSIARKWPVAPESAMAVGIFLKQNGGPVSEVRFSCSLLLLLSDRGSRPSYSLLPLEPLFSLFRGLNGGLYTGFSPLARLIRLLPPIMLNMVASSLWPSALRLQVALV